MTGIEIERRIVAQVSQLKGNALNTWKNEMLPELERLTKAPYTSEIAGLIKLAAVMEFRIGVLRKCGIDTAALEREHKGVVSLAGVNNYKAVTSKMRTKIQEQ